MSTRSIVFEETHFPVVQLRCAPQLGAGAASELDGGFERLFARRARFAIVCDLRSVTSVPDALTRKRLAEVLNRADFRAQQGRYQVCSANVVASAPIRAALTALLWIWTPPSPMSVFAELDEAVRWSTGRLREERVEIPTSVLTWADDLRPGSRSRTG